MLVRHGRENHTLLFSCSFTGGYHLSGPFFLNDLIDLKLKRYPLVKWKKQLPFDLTGNPETNICSADVVCSWRFESRQRQIATPTVHAQYQRSRKNTDIHQS